jgi:hypothetical protein
MLRGHDLRTLSREVLDMSPKSPNPETEAMERAGKSKQPPPEEDRNPKPPPPKRVAEGKKGNGGQGARPRDGL